ncbi:MAG: AglZ/HisF2 family acetamidino modification protein [Bacteroidales bacterium]|nr:AglZ/HisF2 family acetamidino modification protein [Acholeplasmataceae bacterium]MCK9448808.1 AglZ/HisF2 family acetamidino modification protein [Bacteroidales bacterium]
MLKTRIIPALLLQNESLVKTFRFTKPRYIGDPINTVRIFNELEVDELIFLDITATKDKREPNYKILSEIANECFMPLGYGGGICSLEQARKIFSIGFEKILLNTSSHLNKYLISEIADVFGSQAVIVSIDVKKNFWGTHEVWAHEAKQNIKKSPIDWASEVERLGAGEILLTSVDKEGTWSGFDIDLVKKTTDTVNIPVIAHGGAGTIEHIREVVKQGNASAVALGSMVVYQKKGYGVLVNFPDKKELEKILV